VEISEECRRILGVRPRVKASVGPLLGPLDESGADGVPLDIPCHRQQVVVALQWNGLEPAWSG
jgi:hypothetical protein